MRISAISLTLFSLLHLSAGQLRRRHVHQHRANRAFVQKRDKITVTDNTFATPTEVPEVVVYVDQFGNSYRTATETVVYVPITSTNTPEVPAPSVAAAAAPAPPATSAPPVVAPAPVPAPPASSVPAPKQPAPEPSPTPKTIHSEAPVSSAAPAPVASLAPAPVSGGISDLHGVTYSPYKGAGGCKSAQEVDADFALFAKDHGVVRLYGVDCDQVASAYKAAKKYGNKLFLGIFDINQVAQAVSAMADGVKRDWSQVDTVSVGNELVNSGAATVAQSLGALTQARQALRAAGYQGPVVIVDTFVAVLAHPELCDQSDYCAVNVHPFFDPNTGAPKAGDFVTSTVQRIRGQMADSSKRIVVTETGWPWQGNANGQAVPGMDQQTSALSSIKAAYSSNAGNVILFTAFNDLWKKAEASTFMAEQFWGMGGRYSPCDK
ncbi:Uu.00g138610.m01.CDS01 [Anthostomella pinea]|uniref:Uu.00g138610.m01.CDS01 n=1 Tax=Anthostomella pinea TaxID=933095 RepID=A0AAI8VPT3_9PEZI|nr:Uu.00g138610.m01.CDS01 [Anthostomella pinea]